MRRRILAAMALLLPSIALSALPAEAAKTYPIKASVNVRDNVNKARGMDIGRVAARERVGLACQARGSKVKGSTLWDLIEYRVNGSRGAVKRGWIPDYYVKTGTSGRVKGVQYGNCPEVLTRLKGGGEMAPCTSLSSATGQYVLSMQCDGNLVMYAPGGRVVFATGTDKHPGSRVKMQSDGNLVIYSPQGPPLWASNTDGYLGASLDIQNDGNLVVYDFGRNARWSSGTARDKNFVSSAAWTKVKRGATLHVKPTRAGKLHARGNASSGFDEALMKGGYKRQYSESVYHSLYTQYVCHARIAFLKSSWNLDTWRPDVSLTRMIRARCNPT